MFTVTRHLMTVFILLIFNVAFADCPIAIKGFKNSTNQNGIKVLVNDAKTATLAISCKDQKVSNAEALNEFAKVGAPIKITESIYYNEVTISGVRARNYLKMGQQLLQLSLIIKDKNSEAEKIYSQVSAALKE